MKKIYSGKGDDGSTGLLGNSQVSKSDLRIRAVGAIDEASAALGLARATTTSEELDQLIQTIQMDLYRMMSQVVLEKADPDNFPDLSAGRITWLENIIEKYQKNLQDPGGFILPGDNPSSATISVARTVIRRAEREIVELDQNGLLISKTILPYINRLSSLCFILELYLSETIKPASPKEFMTGTILNVLSILIAVILGLLFGRLLSEKARETIIIGLGLFTLGIGANMFLDSVNPLIVLGGLLLGGLLGEFLNIEKRVNNLGEILEKRFNKDTAESPASSKFVRGFMISSILFCTGPMAILGAIQDGLVGDYQLLAIKSVMDGFAAFAMASTFGPGVFFSAPVVFLYQGGFSLLAVQFQGIMTPEMIAEMTATGGLLLIGLSISSLFEIKKIRIGNFIPSLAISPLIVYLLALINS